MASADIEIVRCRAQITESEEGDMENEIFNGGGVSFELNKLDNGGISENLTTS